MTFHPKIVLLCASISSVLLSSCVVIDPYVLRHPAFPPGAPLCIESSRVDLTLAINGEDQTPKQSQAEFLGGKITSELRAACQAGTLAQRYPLELSVDARYSAIRGRVGDQRSVEGPHIYHLDTTNGEFVVQLYLKRHGFNLPVSIAKWSSKTDDFITYDLEEPKDLERQQLETVILQDVLDSIAASLPAIQRVYASLYQIESPPVFKIATRLEELQGGAILSGGRARIDIDIEQVSGGSPLSAKVSASDSTSELQFRPGDIDRPLAAGQTAHASIIVAASELASEGPHSVVLSLNPGVGDLTTTTFSIPVRSRLPQVGAVLTALNDGRTGNANGNGNGRIDPKETVELTFAVYNAGEVAARGVSIEPATDDPNVYVLDTAPITFNTLGPGERKDVTLTIALRPGFRGSDIPYRVGLRWQPSRGPITVAPGLLLAQIPRFGAVPRLAGPTLRSDFVAAAPAKRLTGFPPQLEVTDIELHDSNGNRLLDAGEMATFAVHVRNRGKGATHGCYVEATVEGGSQLVTLKQRTVLTHELEPGTETVVEVPVRADEAATKDGQVRVTWVVHDASRFDSEGVSSVVQTRALAEPDLVAAVVDFNDDSKKGNAQGNGNGKADPGETVEVTYQIINRGPGTARDVIARLNVGHEDIVPFGDTGRAAVGTLEAGQSRKVVMAFSLHRPYSGPHAIPLTLAVDEARPRFSRSWDMPIDVSQTIHPKEVVIQGASTHGSAAASVRIASDAVETPHRAKDQRWSHGAAVVVGIEDYGSLPSATYAEDDAQLVRRYLVESFGIPADRVHMLVGRSATKARIESALSWLELNADRQAPAIFYYSGHGSPETANKSGSRAGTRYLLPQDGDPTDLEHTAVSLDGLLRALARVPAQVAFAVFDACYSGAGGRSVLPQGARPLVFEGSAPPAGSEQVVIMSAAAANETTGAYRARQHGLFTYFFLEGVGGAADASGNHDGTVTLGELGAYVKRRVSEQARLQDNKTQTPSVAGGKPGIVVLTGVQQ